MDMSLMGLIKTMSWPALAIFFLLCLLSVYSLAVSVERWMTFQKAKHQSVKFALEVGQLLKQDKLKEAIDLAKKYKHSHVAKVVSAGLLEFAYEAHGAAAQGHDTVAAAERAIERASMMTTADLKKGLGGLATIATTAPFIGLLGTVIGIINAFRGMAAVGRRRPRLGVGRHRGGARHDGARPLRRHSGRVALQHLPEQDRALPGRDVELGLRADRLLHEAPGREIGVRTRPGIPGGSFDGNG